MEKTGYTYTLLTSPSHLHHGLPHPGFLSMTRLLAQTRDQRSTAELLVHALAKYWSPFIRHRIKRCASVLRRRTYVCTLRFATNRVQTESYLSIPARRNRIPAGRKHTPCKIRAFVILLPCHRQPGL
ncbi:uncharacterized protein [Drosophila pseudoobscura]|uniref:Uncharacterized protein isoform X2 n=1 Tax=Drosophila pseudoobscura pseudoobscura TaxID=46245 RepID=A0A6I8VY31_DROPS|nr:uncharacterized protein LOC26534383 isoform X2 [Drosophila pseudoobscura]